MKKIAYLTFNDAPSGIYAGQVTDVCLYWKELGFDVQLIAFISIRGFSENKKKIQNAFPGAKVLPMFPKAGNWKRNRFLLGRALRKINPQVIVCRGPFASALAFEFRQGRKICFDGRGAYTAELNEYNVIPDEKVKSEIAALEKRVVLESDFRLAVSEKLVQYWKNQFGYSGSQHVVIPCTLNSRSLNELKTAKGQNIRSEYGFTNEDIVIVYSGSGAGWQSLQSLDDSLYESFRGNEKLNLLLLLKEIPAGFKLKQDFPERVKQTWLQAEKVLSVMAACDYGWLVREDSVTNQVASPVKFAEYISAGLKVILSKGLGDYPEFVKQHHAGIIFPDEKMELVPVVAEEKKRIAALALSFFVKEKYREEYLKLLA